MPPYGWVRTPRWISVTTLMQKGIGEFIQAIYTNPDLAPNAGEYTARLNRVANIKDVELYDEDVTGEDKTVDVVVDIFNRVNSAGTTLSKGGPGIGKGVRLVARSPRRNARQIEPLEGRWIQFQA